MESLIGFYPEHLINDTTKEILKAEQNQIEDEEKAIQDLLNEFNIQTATYTLPLWAEFVGIEDNINLDIDTRRSNILAMLKTSEVTTVSVIKNIAESYSNGKCEVIEDFENYKFTIKFTSTSGVPKNVDEIRKVINKVKPAHLNYFLDFQYRTWGDIKKLGLTYGQWAQRKKTWNDLKGSDNI